MRVSETVEVNFDGLVGPTHNHAGLSHGNIASDQHGGQLSSPRAAALQGLAKMKALHDAGMIQAVLPPQERPFVPFLRQLGYSGIDRSIVEKVGREAPTLLAASASASPMWTANAGTVSPFADTADGRTHFSPANLTSMLHRSLEHPVTGRILRRIFADEERFAHHDALPAQAALGDEGAANHTRFCADYDSAGVEHFVYGVEAQRKGAPAPQNFPARQTLEASRAIARRHGLSEENTVFTQQNPAVIDQGVFHNDVIAVGNRTLLFYHQDAFLETATMKAELGAKLAWQCGAEMVFLEVPRDAVPVADAVRSYLFNSQLISLPDSAGRHTLIAPQDCAENPAVKAYLDGLLQQNDSPLQEVRYFDLRQSMNNGGGPACLRLRVVLSGADREALGARVLLDEDLYTTLQDWVMRHYREDLSPADLADPELLDESRTALDELTGILGLGSVYDFQREGLPS
ncbi:N-succinylarginine dihydrolase [Kiloniella sp. b19]|uniref:N-succinylarginine dihydrolase n=1 Tax=Kiloniella sp. GXU_MW_B19 TaxID=3141326 RepID=UPI0031DECDDC